jgi:hypothetical protein
MVLPARCPVFYLGAPQPVACRVPVGKVEAGAERQCVSAQGVVSQRITQAQPGRLLAFHMEDTELRFRSCVTELSDVFELAAVGDGTATRVVRTTRVQVRGRVRALKHGILFVALKAVQRFVFRNWAALLVDAAPGRIG